MAFSRSLLVLTLLLAGASARAEFLDDDYDGALAQARARKLPLLVEVWAPW